MIARSAKFTTPLPLRSALRASLAASAGPLPSSIAAVIVINALRIR